MNRDAELEEELAAWLNQGLARRLRPLDHSSGCQVLLGGRRVLSLGSNNYLGLADHPEVRDAAIQTLRRVGLGAGASRLVTGNYPEHEALERDLAEWKGTEDAVLFDSGYAANTGVLPALARRGDLILSDALNHASLIDGCRLSRALVRVYPHGDMDAARALLADRGQFCRCLLVTDAVFSMDGDLAPLEDLCRLASEYNGWLVIDDAHGTGVLGTGGAGTADLLGLSERVPVQIGTLSKALGASGGFVAGSHSLCKLLRHRARTFVYSTGMPPAVAAGARAAVRLARRGDNLRRDLFENGQWLRGLFQEHGFTVPPGETPIIPVLVGDAAASIDLSERLLREGILAPAIRYPTVPEGQARLRVTASAKFTEVDREWLRKALGAVDGKQ